MSIILCSRTGIRMTVDDGMGAEYIMSHPLANVKARKEYLAKAEGHEAVALAGIVLGILSAARLTRANKPELIYHANDNLACNLCLDDLLYLARKLEANTAILRRAAKDYGQAFTLDAAIPQGTERDAKRFCLVLRSWLQRMLGKGGSEDRLMIAEKPQRKTVDKALGVQLAAISTEEDLQEEALASNTYRLYSVAKLSKCIPPLIAQVTTLTKAQRKTVGQLVKNGLEIPSNIMRGLEVRIKDARLLAMLDVYAKRVSIQWDAFGEAEAEGDAEEVGGEVETPAKVLTPQEQLALFMQGVGGKS